MTMPDRLTLVRAGDRRAMAALMRDLDDGRAGAHDDVRALGVGLATFVVGVTGAPGAGKSTLVDAMVALWRERGERVGVVAVDPSSPLHGGAVLGDRVRMQRHAGDPGVFIRSLASRGAAGGLSRSAMDVATVLGAGGFPLVVIETMGVGQAEVEIAAVADATVVITVPGLGDPVQTLKSGILEIADMLVVNKADQPDASRVVRELEAMLDLRRATGGGGKSPLAPADVPILSTVATSGDGVAALLAAIDQARANRAGLGTGADAARRLRKAEARIRGIVTARTDEAARAALLPGGDAGGLVDEVASRRLDPEAAADALMARLRERY